MKRANVTAGFGVRQPWIGTRVWERPGRRRLTWLRSPRKHVITLWLPDGDGELVPVIEDDFDSVLLARRQARRWFYSYVEF